MLSICFSSKTKYCFVQNQFLGSLILVKKLVNYLGLVYYYDFKYHDPDIIKSIIIMQNCALSCTIESKMITQNSTRLIASQQFSIITSRQFCKIETIIKRIWMSPSFRVFILTLPFIIPYNVWKCQQDFCFSIIDIFTIDFQDFWYYNTAD